MDFKDTRDWTEQVGMANMESVAGVGGLSGYDYFNEGEMNDLGSINFDKLAYPAFLEPNDGENTSLPPAVDGSARSPMDEIRE